MANPAGEPNSEALRLDFDRRPTLQFRGSVAGNSLADARVGRTAGTLSSVCCGRPVFGRLPGCAGASPSQMGRFETGLITTEKNPFATRRSFRRSFRAKADRVHTLRSPGGDVLEMERGARIGSSRWTAQYECQVYVDSSRPLSANSGHSETTSRTGENDPKATFPLGARYGRNAHMSGPSRLNQADLGWHLC
jgi:hypothetical protein